MTSIALVAFLHVSLLVAGQQDFDRAYQQSLQTGRPLVVLVGAAWCPACQKMRNSILPRVAETGGLSRVVFSYVDFDQQRQLASRLSRGQSIPQLIRFDQTPDGRKSSRLVGARSPREVYDFLNAGLIDESKASKVSTTHRPTNDSPKSAPGESARSTPAASRSGTHFSVNAPGGRQWRVGSSLVEEGGSLSHWLVFFNTALLESKNRSESTACEPDWPTQAKEDSETGPPAVQTQVTREGSESEGVCPDDIAGSLSRLVSSSTVSRRNCFEAKALQQD